MIIRISKTKICVSDHNDSEEAKIQNKKVHTLIKYWNTNIFYFFFIIFELLADSIKLLQNVHRNIVDKSVASATIFINQ